MRLDGTDGKLLGVAAGLSKLSGVNVLVFRIALVLLGLFLSGLIILIYGFAGLFVDPRPKLELAKRIGIILLLLGAAMAAALFVFISDTSVLGIHCYHFGSFTLSTQCIKPPIYRAGWVFAVALLALGLWMEFKSSKK